MKTKIDFSVTNCQSLIMLYPESKKADQWVNENLQIEDWQSKKQIAIELRYFDDIYEGIINEGMTLAAN